jgi:chemotaxis methyl-accepting protein methylase
LTNERSIVQEVRERAMRISERFGHDLHKYCEYLREQEKKHPDKLVDQITIVQSKYFHKDKVNSSSATRMNK